jgi:hypothetical protein
MIIDKDKIIGLGLKKYLDKCIECNEAVSSTQFLAIVYSIMEAIDEVVENDEYEIVMDRCSNKSKVRKHSGS